MTTLTITKDNFISMIPQMYQFLQSVPETVLISRDLIDDSDLDYQQLVQYGLDDVEQGNFASKPR